MQRFSACLALMFALVGAALVAADAPAPAHHGIDLAGMDTSVKPAENFYRFANGKWDDATPIPPDRARVVSFTLLQDHNQAILHVILEDAAKHAEGPRDSVTAKVGAFYKSGMDETTIDAAGVKPLREELDQIAAVRDVPGLVAVIARLQDRGVPAPFRLRSMPDLMDSTRTIATLGQDGLGMPDRDYYLNNDDRTKTVRAAYVTHVEKMLTLSGETAEQANGHAQTVLAMETRLAKASRNRVDLREPRLNYNMMTVAQMDEATPGVSWKPYLAERGLEKVEKVNVAQPGFLKEVGAMLTGTPLDGWKTYLRWHLLAFYGDYLSKPFAEESFHFKKGVLEGIPQMQPRWQRVLETTDRLLGEALGQLYVAKAFPPEAKAKALELVQNVKAALRERLETLDWMSPPTRKEALKKLDAIAVKIGYPDKWRDYSALAVDRDVYVLNVMQAEQFKVRHDLSKIGKPVDRSEWGMTPPTVNAYYNPSHNEIVFPAGILQPPFFDPQADDAVNYGAIGAVIGHELTHGFDDKGRQFDADGNLRDWWTELDAKIYKERAALLAKQYDGYVAVDDRTVNGRLTLGENIADLGGLKIAYLALHKALGDKPAPGSIDGFTPEQRFFLSFGQIWRAKMRPEFTRVMIQTNPHSPPRFRVIGPLYNMPEFFQAFHVSPAEAGAKLNPRPVQIW
jgi:putative endopeptidase